MFVTILNRIFQQWHEYNYVISIEDNIDKKETL